MCLQKFDAKAKIASLNKIRVLLQNQVFAKESFRNLLLREGLPSNKMFVQEVINSKLIKRVSPNCYMFNTDKPILYLVLENIYNKYKANLDRYKNNSKPKIFVTSESTPKEVTSNKEIPFNKIESAIKLLKEYGYLIYKQV